MGSSTTEEKIRRWESEVQKRSHPSCPCGFVGAPRTIRAHRMQCEVWDQYCRRGVTGGAGNDKRWEAYMAGYKDGYSDAVYFLHMQVSFAWPRAKLEMLERLKSMGAYDGPKH